MIKQTLVELAVDVIEKHTELERTCKQCKSQQSGWSLHSMAGYEAERITIEGLKNAWTMLDQLNRLAQANLSTEPSRLQARLDEALAAIAAEEREACADATELERITVGDYTITHDLNGDYWIGHKSREGMQVFRLNFEKLISVYYKAEF